MKKGQVFRRQHEPWQVAYLWLKACGFRPNSNFCKEEITTHPDYPSLVSLTDFFASGGLSFRAVQANASFINEFQYPLLAHVKQPDVERMQILKDPREWEKEEDLKKYWSGIVIYPENPTRWRHPRNNEYRQRNEIRQFCLAICSLCVIALFVASIFQHPALLTILFGCLSLVGLTISLIIFGMELGFENQVAKQLCNAVDERGCETVLKSSIGKGIAGVSPADLSLCFFATQFILYLSCRLCPPLILANFVFAFPGEAFAVWSIALQGIILRKWCTLCLLISALLTAQTAISLITLRSLPSLFSVSLFIGIFSFSALLSLMIKQLHISNRQNQLQKAELKKWKMDGELFKSLWRQQLSADQSIWENDLILGEAQTPIRFTVACNPYCRPCARTHAQMDQLLDRFGHKLHIQLRLVFDAEKIADKRTIAAKAILQAAKTLTPGADLRDMLAQWFEWMDYDRWMEKWRPDKNIDAEQQIQRHMQWIRNNEIVYTPTLILNGRRVPNRYSVDDIGLLIPQFEELMQLDSLNLFKDGCG
jgi:hypothetical protein